MDVRMAPTFALVLLTGGLAAWYASAKRRRLPPPPGPAGLPILGSIFGLPLKEAWLTYTEWAKQFSTLIFDQASRKRVLILLQILTFCRFAYFRRPSLSSALQTSRVILWTSDLKSTQTDLLRSWIVCT